jgi:site-specific DNA recombinase
MKTQQRGSFMPAAPVITKKRCAVYTRKSSDEGLEQEYNSLEAQRDAGLAFIASQRHEGWLALDDGFDDGGFSGGNLERPGLRRLMADIEAKKVDIVVVYKIDRLTRSLADFARLVDVFDRNGVSFVSVTQQFNTTTSMGRLTLNILLSFAQFEREVTGERIRDKFAASKAKGMWMGGTPPLGYDVVARKLVVNEPEAALVRDIFRRYAEHGSAATIVRELAQDGVTTKAWVTQSGRERTGCPIDQKFLFKLLRNRIYLGEISNRGQIYPGQHQAIVTREAWDAAHAFIERRKQGPREVLAKRPALLAGLLYAPDGQRMIHSHVRKKTGRCYRYYSPQMHKKHAAGMQRLPDVPNLGHLPAAELENAVLAQVHAALAAPEVLIGVWRACLRHSQGVDLDEAQVVVGMRRIGDVWAQLFPAEQQRILRLLIERVQLHGDGLDIHWREDGWMGLGPDVCSHALVDERPVQEAAA